MPDRPCARCGFRCATVRSITTYHGTERYVTLESTCMRCNHKWEEWPLDHERAQLLTDSSLAEVHYIREAAIASLTRDALLGHDSSTAENALAWARNVMNKCATAEHDGDCTKQPHTCMRCFVDEALKEAREAHDA